MPHHPVPAVTVAPFVSGASPIEGYLAPPRSRVIADAAGRAADRLLLRLIADALHPWPVTVYYLPDYARPTIRVILGAHDGPRIEVPLDHDTLERYTPPLLALAIAREARRRWHVLDPDDVPANITLSES